MSESAAMACQAFTSSFLPSTSHLNPHGMFESRHGKTRPMYPSLCMCSQKQGIKKSPLLAAAFAALTCLSIKPPAQVQAARQELGTSHALLSTPEFRASYKDVTPEGTLLRVTPLTTPQSHAGPDFYPGENISGLPSHSNTTNYQGQVNPVSEWAAFRMRPSIYPHRSPRVVALRPTALGLVSVSAITSGSVLLRNATRKRRPQVKEPIREDQEVCSVVSIQIPFCVSERESMIENLQRLQNDVNLLTPDGMACAAREAARILLGEKRLFEDSRKFAPKVDVFLAENIQCAEKRFAGHVEIEAHRCDRVRNCNQQVSHSSRKYGVVTVVVATTEGVDLACYDEDATIICRLRGALDRISWLRGGQVAGLELQWIPGVCEERSMTRAQLCEAFPGLKVL